MWLSRGLILIFLIFNCQFFRGLPFLNLKFSQDIQFILDFNMNAQAKRFCAIFDLLYELLIFEVGFHSKPTFCHVLSICGLILHDLAILKCIIFELIDVFCVNLRKIEPEHIYKFQCSILVFIETPTKHHILFFESPSNKGLLVMERKVLGSL